MNTNTFAITNKHNDRMYEPIILSLNDDDKYKISMGQICFHRYPNSIGKWRFKLRSKGVDLRPLTGAIRHHFDKVSELRYQPSELDFLSKEPHLTPDYIDYLSSFKLNAKHIHVEESNGELGIYADAPLLKSSRWEIPTMSIVSELWYRYTQPEMDMTEARKRLMAKIALVKELDAKGEIDGFNFSDFGTRRRHSREWQHEVLRTLKNELPNHFAGTSNYYFAQELNLKPIGTMAHEYLQAWQGMVHPFDALKTALDQWALEFRGNLGDALTDVVGMDAFCNVLDMFSAKQFDGFRHDSGDPYIWCNKLIKKLKELNVDPSTKRAIWSDGLDFEKAIDLHKTFRGQIKTGFGLGTNLTNDTGVDPLSMVMKLISLNGRPVAKLPDSAGKNMCECADYERWMMAHYQR